MTATFKTTTARLPTEGDINEFEQLIGFQLPEDYRQHMMQYNGGVANQFNLVHNSDIGDVDAGLAYFNAIKYSPVTIGDLYFGNQDIYSAGYIPIGTTRGGADIILSLNNDSTYGEVHILWENGLQDFLSPSFTQYLEDTVEGYD